MPQNESNPCKHTKPGDKHSEEGDGVERMCWSRFEHLQSCITGLSGIRAYDAAGGDWGGSATAWLRNVNAASAVGVHVLSNQAGHRDELFEDKIFIKK